MIKRTFVCSLLCEPSQSQVKSRKSESESENDTFGGFISLCLYVSTYGLLPVIKMLLKLYWFSIDKCEKDIPKCLFRFSWVVWLFLLLITLGSKSFLFYLFFAERERESQRDEKVLLSYLLTYLWRWSSYIGSIRVYLYILTKFDNVTTLIEIQLRLIQLHYHHLSFSFNEYVS